MQPDRWENEFQEGKKLGTRPRPIIVGRKENAPDWPCYNLYKKQKVMCVRCRLTGTWEYEAFWYCKHCKLFRNYVIPFSWK